MLTYLYFKTLKTMSTLSSEVEKHRFFYFMCCCTCFIMRNIQKNEKKIKIFEKLFPCLIVCLCGLDDLIDNDEFISNYLLTYEL